MKKNWYLVILSILFSIILWISISLSNDYYATLNFPIKLTNFPQGYTTGSSIPEDVSIKLKGKGWKLIAVSLGAKSDYLVSVGKDSGKQYINLYNYLTENQWLTNDMDVIDITPDTLTFVVEKFVHKKVKITSDLELKFKPGFGIASPVKFSPESTVVFGTSEELTDMKSVPTSRIIFKDLDDEVIQQVPLANLQGISYSASSVMVRLDVQKIVEQNYSQISVKVLDVPRDRSVVLLPNKIDISIRGGINILGKLSNSDFSAYLFYRDIVLDTVGSVVPQIKLPDNTSLIYVKPERLRYIIKKFN
jgi:YbbR domain-containing protein